MRFADRNLREQERGTDENKHQQTGKKSREYEYALNLPLSTQHQSCTRNARPRNAVPPRAARANTTQGKNPGHESPRDGLRSKSFLQGLGANIGILKARVKEIHATVHAMTLIRDTTHIGNHTLTALAGALMCATCICKPQSLSTNRRCLGGGRRRPSAHLFIVAFGAAF
jgi:hypothetical protein